MDYVEFAANFVANNIESIFSIGKKVFGQIDENIKINLKSTYSLYLSNTEKKYSISKSFFIRSQAVNLYSYYVPVGIRCGNTTISKPLFNNCVQFSKRIVITGTGGCGKSILVRHLFLNCIRDGGHVPILIELRDLNGENTSLDELIHQTLDKFGFNMTSDYIQKAKASGHFSFMLDGYDEVDYSRRTKLIKELKILSDKFSDCPIIISTRPDEVFNGIDGFNVFKMMPLDLESATNLVEKLPYDEEIKFKFINSLQDGIFAQHQSFLSNPLLLSIMLLTYGENAEIPAKLSIFYNQAYEALFQRHDANKGGYNRNRQSGLDVQDFARIFSLFSLQTYDKRQFKMPRTECLKYIEKSRDALGKTFKVDDYLSDLLSAACLLIEDGLDISYSHRSFQEYFVALHISTTSPELQERLIKRYWVNMTSDNVIELLLEINPDLVERVLFIPIMEELFNEIGVKKSVGITHATKYMKTLYDSIIIDDDGISASWKGNKANRSSVIHLANEHFHNFKHNSEEERLNFIAAMKEKYYNKEDDERNETPLKDTSFKTPIINDILNSNSWLSIKYVQHCYETYKKLKKKHANQTKSIEELLGL